MEDIDALALAMSRAQEEFLDASMGPRDEGWMCARKRMYQAILDYRIAEAELLSSACRASPSSGTDIQ